MNKLEQAARQALNWIDANAPRYVFEAIEEALAEQAEKEPFKMICPRCKVDRVTTQCPNRGGIGDCPMTATAQSAVPVEQAEQEQVAVLDITYGREPECYATPNADDLPEGTYRLYAAPVRTKDLTDDDLLGIWFGTDGLIEGLRAVIAADREKNK